MTNRRLRRRRLLLERLEDRRLLAAWQNPSNPFDVNDDGLVVAGDVLSSVNELNLRTLIGPLGNLPPRAQHSDAPFWVTNCDGLLTSNDILRVINAINLDVTPPLVVAGLAFDTAPFGTINNDLLTSNPAIAGTITDEATGAAAARVSVDGEPATLVRPDKNGNFQFTPSLPLDGTADGDHTIQLVAEDARSNASTPVAISFVLDSTPPEVLIDVPASGQTIGGRSIVSGGLRDASAVEALAYRIDHGLPTVASLTNAETFTIPLDVSGISAGPRTVTVIARDRAGNAGDSSLDVQLALPFAVNSHTPDNGAVDVGVTFRPQVFFSSPVDASTERKQLLRDRERKETAGPDRARGHGLLCLAVL